MRWSFWLKSRGSFCRDSRNPWQLLTNEPRPDYRSKRTAVPLRSSEDLSSIVTLTLDSLRSLTIVTGNALVDASERRASEISCGLVTLRPPFLTIPHPALG